MHDHYLVIMLQLLTDYGITEQQLHQHAAPDMATLVDAGQVDATRFNAMFNSALVLSGDQQFGLRLGALINLPSQGIFGYALMSCATVGDALKLLVRYSQVISPGLRLEMLPMPNSAELLMRATGLPRQLARCYGEMMFASVLNSGVILVGEQTGNVRVELDYKPSANKKLYTEVLGPDVQFGAGRNALCFDAASLAAKISTANPIAGDIFRRECDRLFALDGDRGSVSERVQQVLIESGANFPTCAEMAGRLHMSESTLQRRLVKEGWRYQNVLDQVRYRLAQEYLLGTVLPVAEIGYLLGFGDVANFRRAFKRWAGVAPSQLREGVGAGHDGVSPHGITTAYIEQELPAP
ncbi:MAG: AraC-like DNA-binding protein [Candidatus Pseudothioglobus sp.]|jgi:AraC-like DNA-binding protein